MFDVIFSTGNRHHCGNTKVKFDFKAFEVPERQHKVHLRQVFQKRPWSVLIGGGGVELIMANTVMKIISEGL